MNHSLPLRFSLPAVVLLFGLLLTAIVAVNNIQCSRKTIETEQFQEMVANGTKISSRLEYFLGRRDQRAAEWEIVLTQAEPHLKLIAVMDDRNVVITSSDPSFKAKPLADTKLKRSIEQFMQARKTMAAQINLSENGNSLSGAFPFLLDLAPGELRTSREGVLFLEYDLSFLKNASFAEIMKRTGLMGGAAFFLFIFAWLYLYGTVTRRASELIKATQEIAAGNFSGRTGLRGSDELSELSRSFDQMADAIQTQTEALRKSEGQYRRIVETAGEGIWAFDQDGKMTFANRQTCDLLGYPLSEMNGHRMDDFMFPEDIPDHHQKIANRPAGENIQYERRFRKKDGSEVWTNVSVSNTTNSDGQFLGSLGLLTDITTRKSAERAKEQLQNQLIQVQKIESIGRLAGGVAHDFNNMLTVILGNVQLAQDLVEPGQPLHAHLQEIFKAAEHSRDITSQLLAFARKQTVSPKILDLNATIPGMLKMLRRLLGENLVLTWKPAPDLGKVKMDPIQLDQILANLLVNARDSISDGGNITIEVSNIALDEPFSANCLELKPGPYIRLSVTDNGSGISEDALPHIFEPFFTTKTLGKGTGLGLSMVYGAVRQNGGAIEVLSEVGQGTTFHIYLPRNFGEAQKDQPSRLPEIIMGHGECVLVVEDEGDLLEMIGGTLKNLGYSFLGADSPKEALGLLRSHSGAIHLLLTDVVMPEMNGRVLTQLAREIKPSLKTLFMSGYTADIIADQGILETGFNFIQKPFDKITLSTKIHEALTSNLSLSNPPFEQGS